MNNSISKQTTFMEPQAKDEEIQPKQLKKRNI